MCILPPQQHSLSFLLYQHIFLPSSLTPSLPLLYIATPHSNTLFPLQSLPPSLLHGHRGVPEYNLGVILQVLIKSACVTRPDPSCESRRFSPVQKLRVPVGVMVIVVAVAVVAVVV